MKTLFKFISAAFLCCAAFNANAQTSVYTVYQGKLSFPRDITAACPLLKKGDTASIFLYAFVNKATANLGAFDFTATTTAGVPVTGEGTLIASSSAGTFPVTAMTIGDPLGVNGSILNMDLPVNVKAIYRHHGNF